MIPLFLLVAAAGAGPSREVLVHREGWAAFRDAGACFAVAEPRERAGGKTPPFLSFTHRPDAAVPLVLRLRLSRERDPARPIVLGVAGRVFRLAGAGREAWGASPRDARAIVAALRNTDRIDVTATGVHGHPFTDTYPTAGAPTALDAAIVGCLAR